MFGMNVNGVVSNSELRLVAQEILNKAKTKSKAPEVVESKIVKENPFSGAAVSGLGFVPMETKAAKAGFEQTKVQIDKNIQQSVNSQAAINGYGQVISKSSPLLESQGAAVSDGKIDINAAKKDREGKNPFAFFYSLPKNQEEALNEEKIQSIFAAMAQRQAS